MPPVGFEPTISAGERPQTYALDREASGTGTIQSYNTELKNLHTQFTADYMQMAFVHFSARLHKSCSAKEYIK